MAGPCGPAGDGRVVDGSGGGPRPVARRDAAAGREAREEGGLEDMATRLTHLGLLHWRVWSSLVYDGELEDTEMPDAASR